MNKDRAEVVSAIAKARQDLDRALATLERMADADQKRLSYSVHALNNYLMAVGTTLQMVRTKLDPAGDRDVRRWLDSLGQATHLMMSTARGVLSADHANLPPMIFEQASLAEIAGTVCQGYRDIARKKGVPLKWRPPSTADRVLTDRLAAAAVLDNLVSNAVKYSESGAGVSVAVSLQPASVICFVRDHGPGISAEDQSRMFQRGVRLSNQPTAGESSSGYGLAIASDLTKALGGSLSCASVVGQGSSFAFSLPLTAADPIPEAR